MVSKKAAKAAKAASPPGLQASQGFQAKQKQVPQKVKQLPQMSVGSRQSAFMDMLLHPEDLTKNSLPPVSMPARAVAFGMFQEELLSTDANGNAGIIIQPTAVNFYNVPTITAPGLISQSASWFNAGEAASFQANYSAYVPLVMEVQAVWTGSTLNTSGRFYGIVGPDAIASMPMQNFPQEIFGCESLASNGISCTWYSTDAVWDTPNLTSSSSTPSNWYQCQICIGITGAPVSVVNAISVQVWWHVAAMPHQGICGLCPTLSLPDPSAAMASRLMNTLETGISKSAMALNERIKHRKKFKGVLKDVLIHGGKALGTIFPALSGGMEAAGLLAALIA